VVGPSAPGASLRRSRMRRAPSGCRIELQPRDLQIFRLLQRYRYLRSTYLHAFVGGDKTKLIERLGKLYHEGGYLDRPAQQWEALDARHRPAVYESTAKADAILRAEGLLSQDGPARFGPERNGVQRQFHHTLMICDILASIELTARAMPGLRYVPCDEIRAKAPEAIRAASAPLHFPVAIAHRFASGRCERTNLTLTPDGLFGLEYGEARSKSYRFFALEADRSTMPVARETLRQSSYLRKILGYREILTRRLYKSQLGVPNLLVLTVAASDVHAGNLLRLTEDLCDSGLSRAFLFKPLPRSSEPVPDLLAGPWRRPGNGVLDISIP
jgi:Replication-relaxation